MPSLPQLFYKVVFTSLVVVVNHGLEQEAVHCVTSCWQMLLLYPASSKPFHGEWKQILRYISFEMYNHVVLYSASGFISFVSIISCTDEDYKKISLILTSGFRQFASGNGGRARVLHWVSWRSSLVSALGKKKCD